MQTLLVESAHPYPCNMAYQLSLHHYPTQSLRHMELLFVPAVETVIVASSPPYIQ